MAKFRVRARAVDMLGRQQIAGIPTAIHELFKNAHDAYAKHVEVDYFRGDKAFVLRDDGFGMTRKEFESKWLTIGTESKFDGNNLPVPEFLGKEITKRPILGEKGIGRLAIATIGPQVLVLTRAIRQEGLHDLVVSFIHWGLFEIPGINIDMIDIPVETAPGGLLPDAEFIGKLIDRVRDNINSLKKIVPKAIYQKIIADLDSFDIDPTETEKTLKTPSLAGKGHGTHFYIQKTDSILETDIDERGDTAPPIMKTLLGFSNTMLPGREKPPIVTNFRDHQIDGNVDELIGEGEFFTPQEFRKASDHHFTGRFNEYGQFEGDLSLYKKDPVKYQVSWSESHGRKTYCGPFEINLAYVQGDPKETRLPPSEWSNIVHKLNLIGGLYLYRDGVRILPYGNSDYDFLNIETRRAKAHKDWFFTYRRMFGVVEVNYKDNPNLIEKAGREGFRENRAYRQLKSILENFFKQLAIDYFRKGSVYGDGYRENKEQFFNDAILLKKRKEQKRERNKRFNVNLDLFFEGINSALPHTLSNKLYDHLRLKVTNLGQILDPEKAAREVLKLESEFRKDFSILRAKFKINKPREIGLNKKQAGDWNAYIENVETLERDVFAKLEKKSRDLLDQLTITSGAALDRRRRIGQALFDESTLQKRGVNALRKKATADASKLSDSVIKQAKQKLASLEAVITQIQVEFSQSETLELSDDELLALQQRFLEKISNTAAKESDELKATLFQVQNLVDAIVNNRTIEDETAALESTLKRTVEELATYTDLALPFTHK